MLLTALPTDIIHDIFLRLNSRKSLISFILSNRLLNDVFKSHPNSTLQQVFCNEIGMDIRVLPYAWAHLKCLGDPWLPEDTIPPVRKSLLSLKDSLTAAVSQHTLVGLKQGHQLVCRMAQYYSIRYI